MRVIFFGSCDLSCRVLSALQDSAHEVVGIVTQPDQPAGRKMLPCPTPVCTAMYANDVPVFKPARLVNNHELYEDLAALQPDALMVASYGRIIPRRLLKMTDWPLNVHPSPLPLLRGASPVRTALLQGFEETACCIMKMTPRLDDGDVLLRKDVVIDPHWNHLHLEEQLGNLGGKLAVEALDTVEKGPVNLVTQNDDQATYCGTYSKSDTVIDWTRTTQELYNFIRAWDPEPGAVTRWNGRQLKIFRSTTELPPDQVDSEPGVISAVSKKAFWVGTGDGVLHISEVQPENRKKMDSASFLAGYRLSVGDTLGN